MGTTIVIVAQLHQNRRRSASDFTPSSCTKKGVAWTRPEMAREGVTTGTHSSTSHNRCRDCEEIFAVHLVHTMFIRYSMKRWFRPPRLRPRLSSNLSRRFTSKFHERERVEEERISDYDPARYCPIELGSTLDDTYTTMVKLGFGGTSTTWLCRGRKYAVIEHLPIYYRLTVFQQEQRLQSPQSRRRVHDPQGEKDVGEDCIRGSQVGVFGKQSRSPARTHFREEKTYNCFVFEPLGPSLLEFINRPANQPLSIRRVRLTATLLLHALEFLHTNGIAHTGKQHRRKSPRFFALTQPTQTSSLTTSSSRSLMRMMMRTSTNSVQKRDCLPAPRNSEGTNQKLLRAAR
jgi:hypothetical protein